MVDAAAVIAEFEADLQRWSEAFDDPADELAHLYRVALERERIVTVAYRRDIIEARLASMPLDEEARATIARAIRWAWRDEAAHALFVRGTLLERGALPDRLRAWRGHVEGAVAGWTSSRQSHFRWTERPLTRAAAELLEWAGRLSGKIPPSVRGELHHQPFRAVCAFNVAAETTAELGWRRMDAVAADPRAGSNAAERAVLCRMAEDEGRHAALFRVLVDALDDDDALTISSAELCARIGAVGQRFVALPRPGDPAWENPLGKGAPVVVREGPELPALLDEVLVASGLPERLHPGCTVAVKATFMLVTRRSDPSPGVSVALLGALRGWLEARGCTVSLLDAPNVYDRFHSGRSVPEVATWLGVGPVVDTQADLQGCSFARGLMLDRICATWRDADVRIAVGKLRGHPTTVAMLGLEALEGLGARHDAHVFGDRQLERDTAVLMVADAAPPDLSLLDAWSDVPDGLLGMMGTDDPRQPRRLYASADAVALDRVVAGHLGADPDDDALLSTTAVDWFGAPELVVDGLDAPIGGWRLPDHSRRSALLARLALPVYTHASARGALFLPAFDTDAFPPRADAGVALAAARRAVRAILEPALPAEGELLETEWTHVGGGAVRSACIGPTDVPCVVLLHGYPDTLQLWSRLARRLAPEHCVRAFDWPGLGYSQPWPGRVGPSARADQLLALLDAWGVERAHLIGADMGAAPALVLARRHPERVASLAVMNALLFWDGPTSWEIRLMRRAGLQRLSFAAAPGLVYRQCVRTFLEGDALPEPLDADFLGAFRRGPVRRQLLDMCRDYEDELPALVDDVWQLEVPTLALWAERDHHFPPEHAARLGRLLPEATVRTLAGARHWMAWTRPDEVAAHWRAFAARV